MNFKLKINTNKKFKKISTKVKFSGVRYFPNVYRKKRNSFLVSRNYGLISFAELEAGRKSIRKGIGKSKRIKILIRVYPYIGLTKKSSESRMGRGKGNKIREWVSFVKPGKVIYEIRNISSRSGKRILNYASTKLSISGKVLSLFKTKSTNFF